MFTRAQQYSFTDIYNGCIVAHGDYVGFSHVWHEKKQELIPTDKTTDMNGYLPRDFKITYNGDFDPYHWCHLSTYFWLSTKICRTFTFYKDDRGHYIEHFFLRGKSYTIIVDDPDKFLDSTGICNFNPKKFIFSIHEINFNGPLDFCRGLPIYDGNFCFFVMII